jgi:hypothetical protein
LRGYAERSSDEVVRGRGVFGSNRGQQLGCGRTFSVLLGSVLAGFMVRTLKLFCFAKAVLGGLTRRTAWLSETGGALSLSSGYRQRGGSVESRHAARPALPRCTPPVSVRATAS